MKAQIREFGGNNNNQHLETSKESNFIYVDENVITYGDFP
jgi:hypothetical protein